MSHYTPIDRFTLPGDIPDSAGFDAPTPGPSREREGSRSRFQSPSRLREGLGVGHGVDYEDDPRHLSHPAGRGWQPVSRQRLPGEPPEPSSVDAFAALLDEGESPHAVFTRALQVRFLDRLATCGNVRSACAAAGVSPHTAYKARRRDGAFARLWDAALLLARPHAEAVLAARALDGVEVPILYRGEVIGYRRHYDGRLLLAHLGRLDRAIEEAAPGAEEAAERFEELLALHLGVEPDEALIEASGEGEALPGTLDQVVDEARARALAEIEAEQAEAAPPRERLTDEEWRAAGCPDEDDEDYEDDWEEEPLSEEEQAALAAQHAAMDQAEDGARALWAAWQEAALAAVDAALADPPQDGEDLTPLPLAGGVGGGPVEPEIDTSEPCHPVTPLARPAVAA
ncbi:MAG: hypothetical protein J7493_01490 [Porphyrobacter sp.]|nr:hypothetical protein [Porphyrobacter sp.]